MKKLVVVVIMALALLVLAGCDASTKDKTGEYVLPQDLKSRGCKIYRMAGEGVGLPTLTTVYCPNASVSTHYRAGKNTDRHITSIDEGEGQ